MSTKKDFDAADWENFEVPGAGPDSPGNDLFQSYKTFKSYLDKLPKSELIKRGWMSSANDSASLATLFYDIHSETKSALFRKSNTANDALVCLWFSQIRSEAKKILFSNDIPKFETLKKEEIKAIAQLSVNVEVIQQLPFILAKKGIILIYLNSIPGMKLDGIVFQVAGTPAIGMSIRFPRLDNFWFTLIHELSHIVLHKELLNEPIPYNMESESPETIEVAANQLAKSAFVERSEWRNCEPKYNKDVATLIRFSKKVNIHPSIIAGLLRNESKDYTMYNKIINSLNVRAQIFGHD